MKRLTAAYKTFLREETKPTLTREFFKACENGNLDVIRYLLTSSELVKRPNIHCSHDDAFRIIVQNGHVDILRYMTSSPELNDHFDIDTYHQSGLLWACNNGHLSCVRYLLTAPELTKHADIHLHNDIALWVAVRGGWLNIVKYLLTSTELSDHADIDNIQNDLIENVYYDIQDAPHDKHSRMMHYLLLGDHGQSLESSIVSNLDFMYASNEDLIIEWMMLSLKVHNPYTYLQQLPRLLEYSQDIYDRVVSTSDEYIQNMNEINLMI